MGWRYNTYQKKAREKNGRVTDIKWRWKKEKGKEGRAYGRENATPATQCQEQTELLLLTQIPKHQPGGIRIGWSDLFKNANPQALPQTYLLIHSLRGRGPGICIFSNLPR